MIEFALNFLRDRHYPIPSQDMKTIGMSLKQISGEYNPIRQELWASVYDNVYDFLSTTHQVGTNSRPMATAVSKAYIETLDIAYADGGGSLPVDEDTLAYAKAELNAQLSYVDSLFATLKEMRKEGDFDSIHEAFLRANNWSSALDGFYNTIKMMGANNKMLTWRLGNTEKHCKSCLSLDGQRHRAKWYISRGYTPRKPGSSTDCGGYHCDCKLEDDNGEVFTI